MEKHNRRVFVSGVIANVAAAARADDSAKPQLGVVVSATDRVSPDQALARVKKLGFSSCQLGVGMAPAELGPAIRAAIVKYGVQPTALMTLGAGRMVWNLREGPATIGVIPRATRKERVEALKRASDLAKVCGVKAVHTHCGFIPENPNDALYAEAVSVIKEVVSYARENGQTFLCETGQETPITLLRTIGDVGLDNMAVNLDLANLILYGKGEPVGALDVLGPHVRGLHAKDGVYPTDPYGLGKETPIGSGRVRFPEVFRKLRELNYAGPVTIEREISGERQETDIRASAQFLATIIDREYGRA
ncbi:MAG TPA: sugar phosphate isomerase/epimerase family protein [Bryobacteraceae bacterium]|jgi:sugar phosphate isomerase/epimerase|nr:sugar phosphate isomerase/epimerase family protein [Bryobacteraceae bacterium]